MSNWIAEQLLKMAFCVANANSARGANLRRSVIDYFQRFRDAPITPTFHLPGKQH